MSGKVCKLVDFVVASIIVIGLFLGMLAPLSVEASPNAQTSLQIIEPNGKDDTLAEVDEFATLQMGDPWDMAEISDLQQIHTADSFFENERFADGIFYGNMTYGDGREYIMPLYAGAVNNDAIRIGRIGYNYPIDADRYRYLTFRMYSDGPVCRQGLIGWSEDDTRAEEVSGISNGFYVPPQPCENKTPGWDIYTLDLKAIGLQWGQKPWSGVIRELRIIPVGGVPAGTEIRMDWIRLTKENPTTARPYTIRWQGGTGALSIYASRGDTVLDEQDILVDTVDAAARQYVWQTGVMEAGTYFIYLTDGTTGAWSPGPLVLNTPPVARIEAPSMTSGPDYASLEKGNPWDMNDEQDIDLNPPPPFNICMDEIQFSDGIFHARTPRCPDYLPHNTPMIFLGGMDYYPPGTPDPEVNTQHYRFLSFRYYIEGEQSLPNGWIARFFWWKQNANDNGTIEDPTTGRDIILYEGWNTYKLDLTAPDAIDETDVTGIPWQQAHPNRLVLEPNELLPASSPGYIHLDWIKLTAMNQVVGGSPYTVVFAATKSDLSYQVYYDTDRNPDNGRTPIEIYSPKAPPPGEFRVFIPHVTKRFSGGSLPQPSGNQVRWDTANVPAGQYWISVDVDDGYNATTWYSETPIDVK